MFTDTSLTDACPPGALLDCLSRFLSALDSHDLASFASRLEFILPGEPPQEPPLAFRGLDGALPEGARSELVFSGAPLDEELRMTAFDSSGQALLSRRFRLN